MVVSKTVGWDEGDEMGEMKVIGGVVWIHFLYALVRNKNFNRSQWANSNIHYN